MTDVQFIAGVFTIGMCAAGWLVYRITKVHQDAVKDLTNKLMAKDYDQYKTYQQPITTEEKPKRKPMSYYDDPDLDDEDETTSRQ